MKSYVLLAALVSTAAVAQEPYELDIPSLEDQAKQAEEIKFEAVVNEIRTAPYFAGTYSKLQFRGQQIVVDRRGETPIRTPGNPPPRLETLGSLLGGLSVDARGSVHIEVKREFNADGTLKSESWSIDVGGQWQAESGMNEATGKQHK